MRILCWWNSLTTM